MGGIGLRSKRDDSRCDRTWSPRAFRHGTDSFWRTHPDAGVSHLSLEAKLRGRSVRHPDELKEFEVFTCGRGNRDCFVRGVIVDDYPPISFTPLGRDGLNQPPCVRRFIAAGANQHITAFSSGGCRCQCPPPVSHMTVLGDNSQSSPRQLLSSSGWATSLSFISARLCPPKTITRTRLWSKRQE